jgi:predicted aconitase with swiveling domain
MKKIWSWVFLCLILGSWGGVLPENGKVMGQEPVGRLKGKIKNGSYLFPHKKLRVQAPELLFGPKVRDEAYNKFTQVIFTDDIGNFFRVVTIDNPDGQFTLENSLSVMKEIREKTEIRTPRGRELRVIDNEREGAEVVITTVIKDAQGKPWMESKKPDLLTANAIFELPEQKLIVHAVVGGMVLDHSKDDETIPKLKQQLEAFLSGITPNPE